MAKMRITSELSRLLIRRLVVFQRLLQSPNGPRRWRPYRARLMSRIESRKTLNCTKKRCRFAKSPGKTNARSYLQLTSCCYDTVDPIRTTRFRHEARWTTWCYPGCSPLPTHVEQSLWPHQTDRLLHKLPPKSGEQPGAYRPWSFRILRAQLTAQPRIRLAKAGRAMSRATMQGCSTQLDFRERSGVPFRTQRLHLQDV